MKRLLQALSDMPVVKLKGDRDCIQAGARRAVIARLCSVTESSRHDGRDVPHCNRLFTRDEAIALGTLFFLAMREFGMVDVVASSNELATGLHEHVIKEPMNLARVDQPSEADLIDAAEKLSNGIVTQLEYATDELW